MDDGIEVGIVLGTDQAGVELMTLLGITTTAVVGTLEGTFDQLTTTAFDSDGIEATTDEGKLLTCVQATITGELQADGTETTVGV